MCVCVFVSELNDVVTTISLSRSQGAVSAVSFRRHLRQRDCARDAELLGPAVRRRQQRGVLPVSARVLLRGDGRVSVRPLVGVIVWLTLRRVVLTMRADPLSLCVCVGVFFFSPCVQHSSGGRQGRLCGQCGELAGLQFLSNSCRPSSDCTDYAWAVGRVLCRLSVSVLLRVCASVSACV